MKAKQSNCVRVVYSAPTVETPFDTPIAEWTRVGRSPLRFYVPATSIRHARITSIFQHLPECDEAVNEIQDNGFECFGDLHLARVREVFGDTTVDFQMQRRIINHLRGYARVTIAP